MAGTTKEQDEAVVNAEIVALYQETRVLLAEIENFRRPRIVQIKHLRQMAEEKLRNKDQRTLGL
jgi:hypothetical protein